MKEYFEKKTLTELMQKLEEDGYKIHTLYGNFIFDEETKKVIDCGKPGKEVEVCQDFSESIYKTNGKLAIIFTDKKYIVFANRYFLAIHFCHMRKVRPLSIYTVLRNYDELIYNESQDLLDKLYYEQFQLTFGKNTKPVSYFKDDYTLRTSGFALPGPIIDDDLKEE